KPARGIRNKFITKMESHEKEVPKYPIQNTLTQSIRREAAKQNRPEWMSLWCGQNPRASKQQSVSEMMSEILSEIDSMINGKIKEGYVQSTLIFNSYLITSNCHNHVLFRRRLFQ